MEGIDQAIQKVADLAIRSASMVPTVVSLPERAGVYAIVNPKDGSITARVREPGWHEESLETVAELGHFIQTYARGNSAVFVSSTDVVFIYDQGDRRDRALCGLVVTEEFDWLLQKSGTVMGQAEFVRLLRITLARTLDSNPGLLPLVRQIKFTVGQDGETNIQHGKESMGRSITAKLMGVEAIPEEVLLQVRVYENGPNLKATVRTAIELDAANQRFKLTVFPGELEKARLEAMTAIQAGLQGQDEEKCPPVFLGRSV